MGSYVYSPLEASHIRLIKIAINEQDELHASIEHTKLDPEDPVTYSTLSYVWGDMNTIYEKAETVIAWLGSATPSTSKGIDLVSRVADVAMPTLTDIFRIEEYPDDWVGLEIYEKITVEESKKLGISFEDEEAWDAFADFFDRPWFERIWIVQEILPARKAIMLCGEQSVDWKVMQAAARWYHYKAAEISGRHQRAVNGIDLTVAMNVPWVLRMGSEFYHDLLGQKTRAVFKWSLRRLLETFRPRLATEPKDKVYALLGVSEIGISYSSDLVNFTIDYTQGLNEIFALVTKVMICEGDVSQDDLDIVMTARRRNEEPGWPTWVPDWRLQNGYGCRVNGKVQMFDTGSPYTLGVEGVVLGRATYVSQHAHLSPMLLKGGLVECHDAYVSTLTSYPTGEGVEQAFALTVMAGELPKSNLEKGTSIETYTENYLEWLKVMLMPQGTVEEREVRVAAARVLLKLGFDNDWGQRLLEAYCERRFYMTDTGYMGLGNHNMKEGDVIAVLFGLMVPCVLRPRGHSTEDGYEFIGEAYFHGMMDGEAREGLEKNDDGVVLSGGQRLVLH
ncbi:hypothetical protein AK830_g1717 [Neonectria ditissima]|uniref:Heterokaryon incompatibility domain-containing protein n=1 Tax=Neonectria ditissima TaxID=78410 RepID=A0A0P7BWD6_9HYPO|nr:hypothetical protein AK830_g1717 [Neonectria ditissima]